MAAQGVNTVNPLPSNHSTHTDSPRSSILKATDSREMQRDPESSGDLHESRAFGSRLRGALADKVPPSLWWMRTINMFPQHVFVEDEATVRNGFKRTMCFVVVLVILVVTYFAIQISANIDGKVVVRQTGPNPTLSDYKTILSDPATVGAPSCACGARDVSRFGQSVRVNIPDWGNLTLGTNGLTTTLVRNAYVQQVLDGSARLNIPLPEYAGGANLTCDSMQPLKELGVTRSKEELNKLSPSQRCAGSMVLFINNVLSQFADRQTTFKFRLLAETLPRTLLTPEGYETVIETTAQEKTLLQISEFYSAIRALSAGVSTTNPVSATYFNSFRNVWDDCAVPGTIMDTVDGTQNCTCETASPTCMAEVWVDPHRMYPPGDPQRPSWVSNKPWRIPCPSADLLPTAMLPMYFMKTQRFYEKEYLNCHGGSVNTSYTDLTWETAQRLNGGNGYHGFQTAEQFFPIITALPPDQVTLAMLMWTPISSLTANFDLTAGRIVLNPGLLTPDYAAYFDSCQPSQCQYSYKESAQWLAIFIQTLSVIGGLQIVLRTLVDASFDTLAAWCGKGVLATRNTLSSLMEREGRDAARRDTMRHRPQARARQPLPGE